ncbi:MAG: hypothetical protein ABJC63_15255 [Gemmatimonadales bacterium]
MKLAFAAVASFVVMTVAGPAGPDVFEGRPRFDQGDAVYYVWRDGVQWHVRWTANDRGHDFKGLVVAQGGTFSFLKENDSEKETLAYLSSQRRIYVSSDRADPGLRVPDAISLNRAVIRPDGNDKIVFDARTTNSIGGFDFTPDDSVTIMQLDLQVDKKSVPGLVRLGKGAKKATELPLVVALRGVPVS